MLVRLVILFVGVGIGGGASFGAYGFYASYVNNRGFESQIWPIGFVSAFGSTNIPKLLWWNIYTSKTNGLYSNRIWNKVQSMFIHIAIKGFREQTKHLID